MSAKATSTLFLNVCLNEPLHPSGGRRAASHKYLDGLRSIRVWASCRGNVLQEGEVTLGRVVKCVDGWPCEKAFGKPSKPFLATRGTKGIFARAATRLQLRRLFLREEDTCVNARTDPATLCLFTLYLGACARARLRARRSKLSAFHKWGGGGGGRCGYTPSKVQMWTSPRCGPLAEA